MVSGNLPSWSSSLSQLSFTLFPLCKDSYFSLFNYPIVKILIALAATCVSIIALVAKTILFSWLLIIGEKNRTSCHMMSVCKC